MPSDAAWKQWGEQDPYFGVLAHAKFRRENLAANRGEFFHTGEAQIESVLAAASGLYGSFQRRTAVDFGCGVGRLVIPLSRRFGTVVGLDIAPAMIAEAKANCAAAGAGNVVFRTAPSEVAGTVGVVDFVASFLVLQHIPVRRGMALMRELLDGLAPGGIAALHVTVQRRLPWHKEFVYRVKHHVPGARLAFNLVQGKRLSEPLMQMNNYPLAAILDLYAAKGLGEIFLQPAFGSSLGFTVMGRKRPVPDEASDALSPGAG